MTRLRPPSADPQEVAVALVRGSRYQGEVFRRFRVYLPVHWPPPPSPPWRRWSPISRSVPVIQRFSQLLQRRDRREELRRHHGLHRPRQQESRCRDRYRRQGDKSVTCRAHGDPGQDSRLSDHEGRDLCPCAHRHIYPDGEYEKTLEICDKTSYGLTGSIIARTESPSTRLTRSSVTAPELLHQRQTHGSCGRPAAFGGARQNDNQRQGCDPSNVIRWTSPYHQESFVSHGLQIPFMK